MEGSPKTDERKTVLRGGFFGGTCRVDTWSTYVARRGFLLLPAAFIPRQPDFGSQGFGCRSRIVARVRPTLTPAGVVKVLDWGLAAQTRSMASGLLFLSCAGQTAESNITACLHA
jgi:hypothetical protein